MPRPLRLLHCKTCFCRDTLLAGEICKRCLQQWHRMEAVRQEAIQVYPKLRAATIAQFVAELWKIHQKKMAAVPK